MGNYQRRHYRRSQTAAGDLHCGSRFFWLWLPILILTIVTGCKSAPPVNTTLQHLESLQRAENNPPPFIDFRYDKTTEVMIASQKVPYQNYVQMRESMKKSFKELSVKYPKKVQALARNPQSRQHFKRRFLSGFKTHMIKVQDLQARTPELAAKLELYLLHQKEMTQTHVKVRRQDTLQTISQSLYWTTRRWPELYLLNYQKISNWDRLPTGLQIRAFVDKKDLYLLRNPASQKSK